MIRKVNPVSDFFVRYLWGTEENKEILKDFINSILEDAGFKKIVDLKITNPFNLKRFKEEKESILDIKAEDEEHRKYNVEIQVLGNFSYVKRSLYYWAKNYQQQLKQGSSYKVLNPVICINLLNFVIFDDIKKAHSCFLITEKDDSDKVLTEDLQIHFFELLKIQPDINDAIKNGLAKWAFYFKNEGETEMEEKMNILIKNDEIIKNAHTAYSSFSADDYMLEIYEAREKRMKDEFTNLQGAREEGEQIGIAKGKLEGKIETAKQMYKLNLSENVIQKATGLSKEELKKIK